jgi:hypothetical protein
MIGGEAVGRPRPRRLGVFGGTFDPPHIAHLVVAIDVRDALDLDEVLVVVAGEPWQKVDRREVSPACGPATSRSTAPVRPTPSTPWPSWLGSIPGPSCT